MGSKLGHLDPREKEETWAHSEERPMFRSLLMKWGPAMASASKPEKEGRFTFDLFRYRGV